MYWKPRGGGKFYISNLAPFLTVWLKHSANHSLVSARLLNNFFVRVRCAHFRRALCICSPKPVLDIEVKQVFSASDVLTQNLT